MSMSLRSFRLQLTTTAGYRMIAVTLFLLESLLLRTCLTQFMYSEVALQRTSLLLLRMTARFQGICSSRLCHLSDPLVG